MAANRKPYRVHLGVTAAGRNRWTYCDLAGAVTLCARVFETTRVVLTIEANPAASEGKTSC